MTITRIAALGLFLLTVCLGGMLLVLITGSGCSDNNVALSPTPRTTIADLPVPTTFELEELRSRTFDNGAFRYVDLLYKGSASKQVVMDFYKNQMPIARWNRLTKHLSQGQTVIEYAKGNERCRVTISGGGMLRSTYIQITTWPINKANQPKPKPKITKKTIKR